MMWQTNGYDKLLRVVLFGKFMNLKLSVGPDIGHSKMGYENVSSW